MLYSTASTGGGRAAPPGLPSSATAEPGNSRTAAARPAPVPDLIHPYHKAGRVFGWEIAPLVGD